MNSYKIIVSYKGTGFLGWQIQPEESKTIQGQINRALKIISKSENVTSIASGRTDAGVHALKQVVRIDIPVNIEPAGLVRAINSHIDNRIQVLEAERVGAEFHPVRDALWKEYCYLFTIGSRELPPHFNDLITHFRENLDLDRMQLASEKFVGEHDFQNYFCVGTDVRTTIRSILHCGIEPAENFFFNLNQEELFVLRIKGTGFLKQMVRLIMGALVSVGKGKITPEMIEDSLSQKFEKKLGIVAPPQGLYLNRVKYH